MITLATRTIPTSSTMRNKMLSEGDETLSIREYVSESELQEALSATSPVPELLMTHCAIRNLLEKRYPFKSLRVFSYPLENPIYWYTLEHRLHASPQINIAQGIGRHNSVDFLTSLRVFLEIVKEDITDTEFLIGSEEHLHFDLASIFESIISTHTLKPKSRNAFFYMSPEQMESLVSVDLRLPHGYEFSQVDLAKDATIINDSWEFASSFEHTKSRLAALPSSVIRDAQGNTAAFEMMSQYGHLCNLYTLPEFRRQGLGKSVELKLAQKVAKYFRISCHHPCSDGQVPFKIVPCHHEDVIRRSAESPFWNTFTRNGEPVAFVFQTAALSSA